MIQILDQHLHASDVRFQCLFGLIYREKSQLFSPQ